VRVRERAVVASCVRAARGWVMVAGRPRTRRGLIAPSPALPDCSRIQPLIVPCPSTTDQPSRGRTCTAAAVPISAQPARASGAERCVRFPARPFLVPDRLARAAAHTPQLLSSQKPRFLSQPNVGLSIRSPVRTAFAPAKKPTRMGPAREAHGRRGQDDCGRVAITRRKW